MKPVISVITTVFNCKRYIEESIKSISDQTHGNFEHIIIDDGSTDGTTEIIKKLAENDKRIRFYSSGKNHGRVPSLNMALQKAHGEFIAIQDADDISLPDRFKKQLRFFNENPEYVLLGSDISVIDSDGNIISKPVRPERDCEIRFNLLFKCTLANPSIMFRKKVLDENDLRYEEDFEYAEDFRIYNHIIKFGKVYNLRERLILYRDHSVNSTNRNMDIIREDSAKVVTDNLREYDIKIDIQDAVRIRKLIASKGMGDENLLKDMKIIFNAIKSFQDKNGNKGNTEIIRILKKMIKWPGKKNLLTNPGFSRIQISILKYYIKQVKLDKSKC